MQKESVSVRQAASIIILFLIGSTVVMGGVTKAGQDSWISLLAAAVLMLPVAAVYARIMKLYPGKDLFEILETVLGRIAGKAVIALMVWYALYLGALVIRNFTEFIQISAMPETPQLALGISITLVASYMAKSGLKTMGKWSVAVFPIIAVVVVMTSLLALDKMDFTNIQPVGEDIGKIADGSFQIFSFPLAESVLFLCIASGFANGGSPYKAYFGALSIGAAVLFIVILRNLLTLGPAMVKAKYFSSYVTARVINMGEFFSRIEGVIAMNFVLAGIAKISLCLLAASRGTARLFGINDHRTAVMPIGLIMLALSVIVYKSSMEMASGLAVYKFYAIPFQIIIPAVVWAAAEIKNRRRKKPEGAQQNFS